MDFKKMALYLPRTEVVRVTRPWLLWFALNQFEIFSWSCSGDIQPTSSSPSQDDALLSLRESPTCLEVFSAYTIALLRGPLRINSLSLFSAHRSCAKYPTWVINIDRHLAPTPSHLLYWKPDETPPLPELEVYVAGHEIYPEGFKFGYVIETKEEFLGWLRSLRKVEDGEKTT
jgi:hypothetical protein